ncbi:MAG: hypothetical protein EXQ53_06925 [Acidobacteria bacterium]|nr:hypothetical protein [Acidobacteriota bacterium]
MRHLLTALCVATGVLAGPVSTIAHHGAAAFDTGKRVVMEATVTEWVWSNPHCFLKFDVTDAAGNVRHWNAETSNPPDMVNRGWGRRSFKAGDRVTATVEPVKSGNPVGRLLQVAFADGRILSTQGGGVVPNAGREGAPRP